MNATFSNLEAGLRRAYEAIEVAEKLMAEAREQTISGPYLRDTPASGYWSPEVFQIFALDRAEEAPPLDVWMSLVIRPDVARTSEAAQRAFRERQVYETEFQIRLRDDSIKTLHSRAHPAEAKDSSDFLLVGVLTDITAQTRARSAINAAGDEFRSLFQLGDELSTKPQELDLAQNV